MSIFNETKRSAGRPREIIDKTVGQNLKRLRLEIGLTQAEASKLFSVSEQTVRNWESGRRKVPKLITETFPELLEPKIPTKPATGILYDLSKVPTKQLLEEISKRCVK